MLKVTVELWPGGRESGRRVIATADIGRIRDGAFADYRVRLEEQFLSSVGDEAVVADHPRWSVSVWDLVARCLAAALNDGREGASAVADATDEVVGQYMRHNKATTGFLVLVLQTKNRTWTNPAGGKKIGFQEVLSILSVKAQELEAKDRSRYLRIIGIDATAPGDFRKERIAS